MPSILKKRPVAFRYKSSDYQWIYTESEAATQAALDAGRDSQALYVRDGAPLIAEWQPIETAPLGENDFYLVCCDDPADDRSPFVVRGSIFASARKHPAHHHLSMAYLTHWMPLPDKAKRAAHSLV